MLLLVCGRFTPVLDEIVQQSTCTELQNVTVLSLNGAVVHTVLYN